MSISGVSGGVDMVSQIASNTTASDASMSVLKKAVDASNATGGGLADLLASTTDSGSKLNVYA